jgi:hypothetical protein
MAVYERVVARVRKKENNRDEHNHDEKDGTINSQTECVGLRPAAFRETCLPGTGASYDDDSSTFRLLVIRPRQPGRE